jgi:hypothetical protein
MPELLLLGLGTPPPSPLIPLLQVVEPVPPPKPLTSGWAAILKGKQEPPAPEPASEKKATDSTAAKPQESKPTAGKAEEDRAIAPAAASSPVEAAKAADKPQDAASAPAENKEGGASGQTTEPAAAAASGSDAAESKPKEVSSCWCCSPCIVLAVLKASVKFQAALLLAHNSF